MLVLSRKPSLGPASQIYVNGPCVITLMEIRSGITARIGIEAAYNVSILRGELVGLESSRDTAGEAVIHDGMDDE